MKKILSFLLLAAMLVGCLTPAFSTMAAGAPAIAISDTTYTEQSVPVSVTADVTLADNNTSIVELSLVVYYKNDAITDVTVDLGDSIFTSADNTVGSVVAGTNRNVKATLTAAGLEDLGSYSAVIVELYDDNDGIAADGILAKTTFALSSDLAVGDTAVYGVAVKGAVDIDDIDVEFDVAADEGIATVVKDPYIGIYDELTMFFAGPETIDVDTDTLTVEWRLDGNNDGIVSSRFVFFYDEAWDILDITSTGLWEGEEFSVYPINETTPNENSVKASEYFGIDTTGQKYMVVLVEKAGIDVNVESNGVIATITFKVPEGSRGMTLKCSYPEGDPLRAIPNPDKEGDWIVEDITVAMVDYTVTVEGAECDHSRTHEETVTEATCTEEGSKNVICDLCGEIIDTVAIPATGHTAGEAEVVTVPTCVAEGASVVKCTVCGEVLEEIVVPATGIHTPGEKVITAEPTYDADGTYEIRCTVCDSVVESGSIDMLKRSVITASNVMAKPGKDVAVNINLADNAGVFVLILDVAYNADMLEYKGTANGAVFANDANVIFTCVEDGNLRLYFEAAANADVTANGVLATLNFTAVDNEEAVGVSDIEITVAEMVNFAGKDLEAEVTNGSVEVNANQALVLDNAEVQAYHNTDVEIPVTIYNNDGIWALRAEYAYDTDVLTFTGIASGAFEVAEGVNYSEADGVITVFVDAADMADVIGDGVLYTLQFTAYSEDIGTSAVTATVIEAINANGDDLEVSDTEAAVNVVACTHDGETNAEVTLEPTCTEAGNERLTCALCGAHVGDNVLPALGHAWDKEYTIDVAPTTTSEGYKSIHCSRCDATKDGEVIPMLAAIWIGNVSVYADEIVVPVTLTNNPGAYSISIEVAYDADAITFAGVTAGAFDADEFSASAHDGVITVYVENADIADITENDVAFYLTFTAENVDAESALEGTFVAENTINANGENVAFVVESGYVTITHYEDYEIVVNLEPTCTEDGSQTLTCKVCGEAHDEAIPALGHDWEADYTIEKEATEFEEGYKSIHCTRCDATKDGEVIPKLVFISGITHVPGEYTSSAMILGEGLTEIVVKSTKSASEYIKFIIYTGPDAEVVCDGCEVGEVTTTANGEAYGIYVALPTASGSITVTNAQGISKTYTLTVEYDLPFYNSIGTGYNAKAVDMVDGTMYIYAAANALTATGKIVIPAVNEYVVDENLETVISGNIVYVKDTADNDTNEYTLEITTPTGETLALNIVFVYDIAAYNSVAVGNTTTTESVVAEDDTITVTAVKNSLEATMKLVVPAANTVAADDDVTVVVGDACNGVRIVYVKVPVTNNNNHVITITTPDGVAHEYNVAVVFDIDAFSELGAYTGVASENGIILDSANKKIIVNAASGMYSATIGVTLYKGSSAVGSDGLYTEVLGNVMYFRAAAMADNYDYTITVTKADGTVVTYDVTFVFDKISVVGGSMIDSTDPTAIVVDDGVINITTKSRYNAYASFRFAISASRFTIAAEDGVEVVPSGSLTWYKIARGTGTTASKTFTITDTVTGTSKTVTVNVQFGA